MSRRLGAVLIFLALLASRRAAAQISEGTLKALVVEKFTRFIDWPPETLPQGAPFVVCLLGTSAVADDVAKLAKGRPFKERSSSVRRVKAGEDLGSCHILFIADSEAPRLPRIVATVATKPILTVSDTPGFAERGVLINLYMDGPYVRFEVSVGAAARSKLRFSAKLLRLARMVGLPPEPGADRARQ